MLNLRFAAMLLAGAFLSGCGGPGVYGLSPHDAYTRLADNKLEDFAFSQQCGILIHLEPEGIPDKSVTWHVYSSGANMVSFTAQLTAKGGNSTKVDIEISKDSDGTEAYSGNDDYPRPALRQPLRPAVEEAIASALEGRKFDESRFEHTNEGNSVCNVQRAGLESGRRFSVDDEPGMSSH
jgi:hypothetical protein